MKPRNNLTGLVFGKLTVLEFSGKKSEGRYEYSWHCSCSCGKAAKVLSAHLLSGAISDCGCGKRSLGGFTAHPLFHVWDNMVRRCTDPTNKSYADYGGRGITVDVSWLDPWQFVKDMGPRPNGLTLERVDNAKGYGPENCVWADRLTQASNKRNVPIVEFAGKAQSIAQWSRELGVHPETLRSRVKAGKPMFNLGV